MPDVYQFSRSSDPDRLRTLRGWSRPTSRDPATLDRQADLELVHGHHHAADRLALLAANLRGVRP